MELKFKRLLYLGICLDLFGEAVAAKILLSVPQNFGTCIRRQTFFTLLCRSC